MRNQCILSPQSVSNTPYYSLYHLRGDSRYLITRSLVPTTYNNPSLPQCLIPCIVQLFSRKIPVISYLRSIQKVGMLVRMHVMTDRLTSASGTSRPERPLPPSNNPTIVPTRLERLEQNIQAYGLHSKVC